MYTTVCDEGAPTRRTRGDSLGMIRIAVVGLGAMGLPVARRLAGGDAIELALFDADSARLDALHDAGRRATSVADAAAGADAVFTILPADTHVEAVTHQLAGRAGEGLVLVDFSTVAPATIERVAARLADAGVATVSATIAGGTLAAERGELTLFVGGDLPPALGPALEVLAAEVRHVGSRGAAKAVKLANNMVLSCLDVAICEALVLGRVAGLSAKTVTDHLAEHGADSWALSNHVVRHVLADDLGPGHFSTRHMAKDLRLYIDLARDCGLPAPLAGAALAAYRGTIAMGLGEHYHPIVIRWLERAALAAERGAVTPAAGDADALAVLGHGVVALQHVVSVTALGTLRRFGIDPATAADLLALGSARNESLPVAARQVARDEPLEADVLVGSLAATLELADRLDVPAAMLESARHAALELSDDGPG